MWKIFQFLFKRQIFVIQSVSLGSILHINTQKSNCFWNKHDDQNESTRNMRKGKELFEKGHFEEAQTLLLRSFESFRYLYGQDHLTVARNLELLGHLNFKKGEFQRALEFYEKTKQILLNYYDIGHEDVVDISNKIAIVNAKLGNYQYGLQSFQEELDILLKNNDPNNLDVARVYQKMAEIYKIQGKIGEAFQYQNKALDIYKNKQGEQNLETAKCIVEIGILQDLIGSPREAISTLQRAAKLGEIVQMSSDQIGKIYFELGKSFKHIVEYNESLLAFNKSIQLFQKNNNDEENLEIGEVLYQIGGIYQAQKKNSEALNYFNQSVKIMGKQYGSGHKIIKEIYKNIGFVYEEMGDNVKAQEFFMRSSQQPIKMSQCKNFHIVFYKLQQRKTYIYQIRSETISHPNIATRQQLIGYPNSRATSQAIIAAKTKKIVPATFQQE